MNDGGALLSTLATSADSYVGSDETDGVAPIPVRCEGLRSAYRDSWRHPDNDELFQLVRNLIDKLLRDLFESPFLPDIAMPSGLSAGTLMPRPDTLRKDLERLAHFCARNRRGIGEVILMYALLLLCRHCCNPEADPCDPKAVRQVGRVLWPGPEDKLPQREAPYSVELVTRYSAVRCLGVMKKLGLLDETPPGKLSPKSRSEISQLVSDKYRSAAGKYIPRLYRPAFQMLDAAFAVQAYAIGESEQKHPDLDSQVDELLSKLRGRLRRIDAYRNLDASCRERLRRLGIVAAVRGMIHAESELGVKMHAFLRRGKHFETVRHRAMFETLPDKRERLMLLNFLFMQGAVKDPDYFVREFGRFFDGGRLQYMGDDIGFGLAAGEAREEASEEKRGETQEDSGAWVSWDEEETPDGDGP